MKIKSMLLSVSCLMALPLIQAQADPISLVNGDFSANQGQSKIFFWDSTGASSGLIPGWTPTGPGSAINYDLGGAYVGNSGVDGLADNSNYGGFCHLWLDSYDPAVYNTSSYTIQPGDNYSLSFNINGEWSPDGNHNTAVSLYYLAGSTRVIFDTFNVNVPINWSYTWTPESFTGAAPSAAFGDLLGVEIQNVTPESGIPTANDDSYTALGNVVLSTVPEPASIALFGLGGLALLAFRRRA